MKNIKEQSWHYLSLDELEKQLDTSITVGLTQQVAQNRLIEVGGNVLDETNTRSLVKMILDQFTDFLVLILIASAIIAAFLGGLEDTIAIAIIVILNSALGFFQEYRAEKAMEALRALSTSHVNVLRSGHKNYISSDNLIPGDVVLLEAGNIVPADLRLFTAIQLQIEEASLTGESQPVEKTTNAILELDTPITDRLNMAYKGTLVANGRGAGIVVATGMHTELGRIATLLRTEKDTKTPLQKRLAQFGKKLALAVIVLCAIIFIIGVLRGERPLLMFMTALSLAVAAIPEALPAVVTVLLALGAKRMVKQNTLIRHLPAVETLGSVTYICTDKTGTLTQNQMEVDTYLLNTTLIRQSSLDSFHDKKTKDILLMAMALNNDASLTESGKLIGDPTETALYRAAQSVGFAKTDLEKILPRVGEIPFSSERAMMTTIHREHTDNFLVFTKGAPERVLSFCNYELKNGDVIPVDCNAALAVAETMAKEGRRVIAIAHKRIDAIPPEIISKTIETDLIFIGLVGLIDPPRPEAKQSIELCQNANINVVMITGDHPATALAIARELGIINEKDSIQGTHGRVVTGEELSQITDEDFNFRVKNIRVYARVTPEQKISIVKALQQGGEFVAMTGDGVNDAPALKKANIGVAMGKIGTDVAREAAHMVLLDDNFSTIVIAVREGRRIFDNIRKFIKYSLTSNAGEIWTIFLAPFLGLPIPFLPIHILWINLVTDGLPGLSLAAEPEEMGIMNRPPRRPNESIFAHGLWQHALWVGLLMGVINLSVMAWAYHKENAHWQSMVFTILTLSQMGHILAIRSERESIFKQGIISNLPLLSAVTFTFIIQMIVLYVPIFNKIFKTQPLSFAELFICLAVSPIIFIAVEIEKLLVRKGYLFKNRKQDRIN